MERRRSRGPVRHSDASERSTRSSKRNSTTSGTTHLSHDLPEKSIAKRASSPTSILPDTSQRFSELLPRQSSGWHYQLNDTKNLGKVNVLANESRIARPSLLQNSNIKNVLEDTRRFSYKSRHRLDSSDSDSVVVSDQELSANFKQKHRIGGKRRKTIDPHTYQEALNEKTFPTSERKDSKSKNRDDASASKKSEEGNLSSDSENSVARAQLKRRKLLRRKSSKKTNIAFHTDFQDAFQGEGSHTSRSLSRRTRSEGLLDSSPELPQLKKSDILKRKKQPATKVNTLDFQGALDEENSLIRNQTTTRQTQSIEPSDSSLDEKKKKKTGLLKNKKSFRLKANTSGFDDALNVEQSPVRTRPMTRRTANTERAPSSPLEEQRKKDPLKRKQSAGANANSSKFQDAFETEESPVKYHSSRRTGNDDVPSLSPVLEQRKKDPLKRKQSAGANANSSKFQDASETEGSPVKNRSSRRTGTEDMSPSSPLEEQRKKDPLKRKQSAGAYANSSKFQDAFETEESPVKNRSSRRTGTEDSSPSSPLEEQRKKDPLKRKQSAGANANSSKFQDAFETKESPVKNRSSRRTGTEDMSPSSPLEEQRKKDPLKRKQSAGANANSSKFQDAFETEESPVKNRSSRKTGNEDKSPSSPLEEQRKKDPLKRKQSAGANANSSKFQDAFETEESPVKNRSSRRTGTEDMSPSSPLEEQRKKDSLKRKQSAGANANSSKFQDAFETEESPVKNRSSRRTGTEDMSPSSPLEEQRKKDPLKRKQSAGANAYSSKFQDAFETEESPVKNRSSRRTGNEDVPSLSPVLEQRKKDPLKRKQSAGANANSSKFQDAFETEESPVKNRSSRRTGTEDMSPSSPLEEQWKKDPLKRKQSAGANANSSKFQDVFETEESPVKNRSSRRTGTEDMSPSSPLEEQRKKDPLKRKQSAGANANSSKFQDAFETEESPVKNRSSRRTGNEDMSPSSPLEEQRKKDPLKRKQSAGANANSSKFQDAFETEESPVKNRSSRRTGNEDMSPSSPLEEQRKKDPLKRNQSAGANANSSKFQDAFETEESPVKNRSSRRTGNEDFPSISPVLEQKKKDFLKSKHRSEVNANSSKFQGIFDETLDEETPVNKPSKSRITETDEHLDSSPVPLPDRSKKDLLKKKRSSGSNANKSKFQGILDSENSSVSNTSMSRRKTQQDIPSSSPLSEQNKRDLLKTKPRSAGNANPSDFHDALNNDSLTTKSQRSRLFSPEHQRTPRGENHLDENPQEKAQTSSNSPMQSAQRGVRRVAPYSIGSDSILFNPILSSTRMSIPSSSAKKPHNASASNKSSPAVVSATKLVSERKSIPILDKILNAKSVGVKRSLQSQLEHIDLESQDKINAEVKNRSQASVNIPNLSRHEDDPDDVSIHSAQTIPFDSNHSVDDGGLKDSSIGHKSSFSTTKNRSQQSSKQLNSRTVNSPDTKTDHYDGDGGFEAGGDDIANSVEAWDSVSAVVPIDHLAAGKVPSLIHSGNVEEDVSVYFDSDEEDDAVIVPKIADSEIVSVHEVTEQVVVEEGTSYQNPRQSSINKKPSASPAPLRSPQVAKKKFVPLFLRGLPQVSEESDSDSDEGKSGPKKSFAEILAEANRKNPNFEKEYEAKFEERRKALAAKVKPQHRQEYITNFFVRGIPPVIPKQPVKPKPVPKAVHPDLLVDGKVWRPPKLAKLPRWCSNRLIGMVERECVKRYGEEKKVRKAHKFLLAVADNVKAAVRRKKNFEVSVNNVKELLFKMDLIYSLNDFHAFVEDYLPGDFRYKAIPTLRAYGLMTGPKLDPNVKLFAQLKF